MLFSDLLLDGLELVGVEGAAADQVSKKLDGLADVAAEDLQLERALLAAGLRLETGSEVLDVGRDLGLGAGGGPAEEHLLEQVG
jgi:hypothetical protein